MKTCSKCSETKDFKEFAWSSKDKNFISQCNECERKRKRDYYRKLSGATARIPIQNKNFKLCKDCGIIKHKDFWYIKTDGKSKARPRFESRCKECKNKRDSKTKSDKSGLEITYLREVN